MYSSDWCYDVFFLLWEVVLFANKNYIINLKVLPRVSFTPSYRLKSKLDNKNSSENKTVEFEPIISWLHWVLLTAGAVTMSTRL